MILVKLSSPLQRKRACTFCKKIYPSYEFYRKKARSTQYRSRCKKCYQAHNANNHDRFKEKERKSVQYLKRRYVPLVRLQYASNCAHRRGLEWSITLPEYISFINKGCYYCGSDLLRMTGAGLDRIDNKMGYTHGNVLPCCSECNVVRSSRLTVDEMVVVAKALKEYRAEKCKQVMV